MNLRLSSLIFEIKADDLGDLAQEVLKGGLRRIDSLLFVVELQQKHERTNCGALCLGLCPGKADKKELEKLRERLEGRKQVKYLSKYFLGLHSELGIGRGVAAYEIDYDNL